MSVSTGTIAALRTLSATESAHVSLWVGWVESDVNAAATAAGIDPFSLDPEQLDRFVIEAILHRLAHPDDATQVDVQVDDTRISKRYATSTGQFAYMPHWWAWLGIPAPASESRGAFTVTPYGAPDTGAVDAWA